MRGTAALDVDRLVQIHPEPLHPLHPEAQRIGPRQIGVVLQQQGLAVGAADRGRHHIAQLELHLGVRMVGPAVVDHIGVQPPRLGGVGRQRRHPVAPVQVDPVGDRPDAVRRVQLPVAVDRMPGAPARLGPALGPELDPAAIGLLRIAAVELHRAQIVLIAALQMDQFAEQPGAHHVQHRQHVAPITDVLQHHIGRAGPLVRLQHVPVILQADARHHLAADRDLRLHRRDGHGGVPFPRGGDDDRIQPRMGQQVAIGLIGRPLIGAGRGLSGGGDHPLGPRDHQRFDVAQGDDVHIGPLQQNGHQALRPQPRADDPDLQPVVPRQGRSGQGRGGDGGGRGGDEGAAIHDEGSC